MDAAQLKHHLSTQSHKSALRKLVADKETATTGQGGTDVRSPPSSSSKAPLPSATVESARELLSSPPRPAQVALRERYQLHAWPASVTATHLPRIPHLSIRPDFSVCYQCHTVAPTARLLTRLHQVRTDAEGATACGLRSYHIAHVQSLQRGNKVSLFPVVISTFTTAATAAAAAAAAGVAQEGGGGGGGGGTGAAAATSQAAMPKRVSSSILPLDVFLRGPRTSANPARGSSAGGGAGGGAGAGGDGDGYPLSTSGETADNQCGGLLQQYRFHEDLSRLHWTAAGVAQHFGPFLRRVSRTASADVENRGATLPPSGAFYFACIQDAVLSLFNDALSYLRKSDQTTLLSRLRIGQTSDLQLRRFNIHVTKPTLVRYARDVAIVLYVTQELAALADRPAAAALEADNASVTFDRETQLAALNMRDSYRTHAASGLRRLRLRRQRAQREPQQQTGGEELFPGQDDTTVLANSLLVPAVSSLLSALCHETYDPRLSHVGGENKPRCDLALAMPFVSVAYASGGQTSGLDTSSAVAVGGGGGGGGDDDDDDDNDNDARDAQNAADHCSHMSATAGGHLATSLLFATHIVNTLFFMNVPTGSVEESFERIAMATNPTSTTAAAYIVQLSSSCEAISRSETVAPAFIPCDDPSHLPAGAPPGAVCGTLLHRGLHMSTATVGARVRAAQRELGGLLQQLTFGYDPTGSGFYAQAVQLIDSPNVQSPGVFFLELPVNARLVSGWRSHMIASGVLDSPDCPVRVAVKPSERDPGVEELDLTAPPVVTDAAKLRTWRQLANRCRALIWAITHCVGGAPARMTESAGVRLCASSARAHRSVFVHNGLVYTVITYWKGQVERQGTGRPIVRWHDAPSSSLVIQYLVFVEPLDAYLSRAVDPAAPSSTLIGAGHGGAIDRALLFRDERGQQLQPRALTAALADDLLLRVSTLPITVRVLRQYINGVGRLIADFDPLDPALGTPAAIAAPPGGGVAAASASVRTPVEGLVAWGRVLDAQMGHTSATATTAYAGDPTHTFGALNNTTYSLFRIFSTRWHAALGLSSAHGTGGLTHPLSIQTADAVAAGGAPAAGAGGGGGAGGGIAVASDSSCSRDNNRWRWWRGSWRRRRRRRRRGDDCQRRSQSREDEQCSRQCGGQRVAEPHRPPQQRRRTPCRGCGRQLPVWDAHVQVRRPADGCTHGDGGARARHAAGRPPNGCGQDADVSRSLSRRRGCCPVVCFCIGDGNVDGRPRWIPFRPSRNDRLDAHPSRVGHHPVSRPWHGHPHRRLGAGSGPRWGGACSSAHRVGHLLGRTPFGNLSRFDPSSRPGRSSGTSGCR